MIYSRVVGTGSSLPARVLTNDDLARMMETSDEWISTRTGIRQRHVAADHEMASDLGAEAGRRAVESAGLGMSDIDLVIVATTTPDMMFPSTACILQRKLGIGECAAFDVQAVCTGFVYALATADLYIKAGKARNALVVGTEVFTRLLDWTDRATCVLFGDGAGAVVLQGGGEPGILASRLHADGRHSDILCVDGHVDRGHVLGDPFVRMDGNAVFRLAVKALADVAHEVLDDAGLTADAIDWFIPHQANIRIMESSARRLGIPMERVVSTVSMHGNTSAASIPLALDHAVRNGGIRPGEVLLLEGVGGGFTWGAVLLRW
ncbi:MAG: beta-ketoacyl-ACP synthase III [Vicinamibacterales bacterium]